ncbi:MAG: SDR family oxidoreductase [Planctomycetota bacterium]
MDARGLGNSQDEDQSFSTPVPLELDPEELRICLQVLQQVADDPAIIDHHSRFKTLVAKIHREGQRGVKKRSREIRLASDQVHIKQTGIIRQQHEPASQRLLAGPASNDVLSVAKTLVQPRICYICKQKFTVLHAFYHSLCPLCSELNWKKRQQRADLHSRTALVTGGRIKIGFQTVLKLLRDGARVIVTTRFPHDAAQRFSLEPDFTTWSERLEIHGLDLRDLPQVEVFAAQLLERDVPLDILIHNAAQTVKRPLAFYRHLLEGAALSQQALLLLRDPAAATVLLESRPRYRGHLTSPESYFPTQLFDQDGQQVDCRPNNSWVTKLGEISTIEMLETWLVNAAAPFILTSRLKSLLLNSPHRRRFVVNVSAMEGQFGRHYKSACHPHTNMAKAALNMLTRTSAADLADEGIFMNSVDTGWITDENPLPIAQRVRSEHGFYTPLDVIDGAARIYDPIASGISQPEEPVFGQFLKDYQPYAW